jgi:adenylate kinase family enzyme
MKILVFGLPGSGKTTFAKQLTAETEMPHFNADENKRYV